MTPKEAYWAAAAARKLVKEERVRIPMSQPELDAELLDFLDRFATAVERIANAMEKAQ